MTLPEVLAKHDLTIRAFAAGAGITPSSASDVVNGKRCPTTGTVNRILAFVRRYERRVSYEDLFAPELAAGRGRIA